MVKEELIQRSPVRAFMKNIKGGLRPGEMGFIVSPNGLGKTSVLVQIALDKILQGRKVIHVSFTQHTDYVLAWYDDIFDEFTKKKNLENEQEVKNDLAKNRVLMKFNQEYLSVDQILRSLRSMIADGGFKAEYVIVDGYNFSSDDGERLSQVKAFAKELGLAVWYSCTVKSPSSPKDESQYDSRKIPLLIKNYADMIDVVIVLESKGDHIELSISKERGNYNPKVPPMRLDPKTLLILE
jgi:KaiC/GvpD/RAD55 family RecA-like ATPase